MKKCIITVYYLIDNFCKIYEEWTRYNLLSTNQQRYRIGKLSLAELITIVIYFYLSPCKDFKNYYLYYLPHKYKGYFNLPCYSRIVQLWPRLILPLSIMLQLLRGEDTGTYFIDSTKLSICHAKRTSSNRVFGKIAKVGMSSYGWFMGFKLHLIINNKAEIIAIKITKANRTDLSVLESITQKITGKVFGDKAYICKELWFKLYSRNLRMITNIRKDMKNYLLELEDKAMLWKRVLIESVFNILKNRMNLEHTMHRSPVNFLVHILACVTSYAITKSHTKLDVLAT